MPAVDEKAEHLCGESRAAQDGILYSVAKCSSVWVFVQMG